FFFFFQAEDGIRDLIVTGVQTCALPISGNALSEEHALPAAGLYEPGLVGKDDCLHAVAQVELGEDVCEVRLHSRLAEDERGGERSEERRVGKECRFRGGREDSRRKKERE